MSVATRHIPFLDLAAQYKTLQPEIDAAIAGVIEKSAYISGPAVEAFERDFAAYCDARHHVAVGSGTDALHLALLALGVGPGDEVITQANTFIATLEAIAYTGAHIVLVDVAPPYYDIDIQAVSAAISPRTKVIIPVHLYGHPAPLDALRSLAARYGIAILDDAAQAHGARYRGRRIGSDGLAAFSYYPSKNLGAYGEGGGVTTNDDVLAQNMRRLRDHGGSVRYVHDTLGYNYRMDGIQGAVLRVKLRYLDRWNAQRRSLAATYDGLLGSWPRPAVSPDVEHVYHIYPVFVHNRELVIENLREAGVSTGIHYPIPAHLQKAFEHLGYSAGAFPNAEQLANEELSLPIYPELEEDSCDYVVAALRCAAELAA